MGAAKARRSGRSSIDRCVSTQGAAGVSAVGGSATTGTALRSRCHFGDADNGDEFVGRGPTESDDDVEKRSGEFLAAAVRKVQEQGVDPETALLKVNSILRDRVLRAEEFAEGWRCRNFQSRTESGSGNVQR